MIILMKKSVILNGITHSKNTERIFDTFYIHRLIKSVKQILT